MSSNNYIAIDLGATSGRVIVISENHVDEIYRFKDYLQNENNSLVWDVDAIFHHILTGLKLAVKKYHTIKSLAIDSWGVDYALLKGDELIKPVYAYRDARTQTSVKETLKLISEDELYQLTGTQNNPINTIHQLMDDLKKGRLKEATDFLFIPEYFTYRLTGKKVHEQTMASTSGLLDLNTHEYHMGLIKKLNYPAHLFKPLVTPGYVVGGLKPEIIKELGVDMEVKMCASHDTASVFYEIDAPSDAMIISSGTWSLIGVKLPQGNNSSLSMKSGFTNETTKDAVCFLKNIMGMWLFNEVLRKRHESYDEVTKLALASTYNEVFDVNDPSLLAPADMADAIQTLLKHNPPRQIGDLYRTIFRSLATAYQKAADAFETILKQKFNKIYIVGGGAKNHALNTFTQEITKREVIARPIEATAIGNVKAQR
ncbi:MAG: rhamnulokinase [Bacilli bacterium]|nr:rhamnulokinase [Bacilli bacterium]